VSLVTSACVIATNMYSLAKYTMQYLEVNICCRLSWYYGIFFTCKMINITVLMPAVLNSVFEFALTCPESCRAHTI
jgi:hypothetical protein